MWGMFEGMADDLRAMSNGRLDIEVYAVGELVPWSESLEAVGGNVIQMNWTSTNTWAGKNAAFELLGATPFGMSTDEYAMWYYVGDGMKYAELLYTPYNVIAFPTPAAAAGEVGGYSTMPVYSLADMQGKVFRSGAGVAMEVMTRAGINALWTAGEEIYTGLDRGVIDIVKWGGPYDNWGMKFHEVAKYVHGPGWHKPGHNTMIEVNLDPSWNSLPDDIKIMLKYATESFAVNYKYQSGGLQGEYFQKLKDYGVTVTKLPDEDVAVLIKLRNEVMTEMADGDPVFKEIWQNQEAFVSSWREYKSWDSVTFESYKLAEE